MLKKPAKPVSEVSVVKQLIVMVFSVLALAGCKDRVIWNDNGKVEEATEGREVWNSNGQMESGERKIWVNKDGEEVVK
nr:hypothetical protein [Marinobacter sp. C7]